MLGLGDPLKLGGTARKRLLHVFRASFILESKAKAYKNEATFIDKLLALPVNIGQGRKYLPVKYTLAYFSLPSVTKKNCFITLTPGGGRYRLEPRRGTSLAGPFQRPEKGVLAAYRNQTYSIPMTFTFTITLLGLRYGHINYKGQLLKFLSLSLLGTLLY